MSNIDYELIEFLPLILPKLIISTICGVIIGYDREIKHKAAGIRTMILICAGSALFTSLSFIISSTGENIDPTRIISQIITGIGFVGAGVIMKNEDKIVGVTTAAFIWCVSAIGVLCGTGAYLTPIVISLGLLITSRIFERVEKYIKKKNSIY